MDANIIPIDENQIIFRIDYGPISAEEILPLADDAAHELYLQGYGDQTISWVDWTDKMKLMLVASRALVFMGEQAMNYENRKASESVNAFSLILQGVISKMKGETA
jgi:hypothetical protein